MQNNTRKTAVVVAFFVCFAPFHAQRLMAIYVKNPSSYEKVAFNTLTYISGVAYYLTATINPILYSIMSVRFRQAFHDTFVRTFCPSKSAIFQCTRQRTMSGMYNSMYYRASHPHIHHPLPAEVAAGGGDRGGGGGSGVRGPFGARSKSITAAAVIGAPINIVTHSIIKNVNGGAFGGGGGGGSGNQQKSLAFADNHQNHRMPSTLFEEEEGGDNLSSGERSEEIEEYHPHHQNSSNKALQHQVMRMNGGSGHHDSIGSDDLEGAWPPKTMNV
ncbi:G-protein coupled receptor [Tyrophagus putrescentiae]|nr:G-protein coupled receptor [Tyrophagus putrescentiae]